MQLALDGGPGLTSAWAQERRWHGSAAAILVHAAVALAWLSWPAAPPPAVDSPVFELVLAPPPPAPLFPAPEPLMPAAPVQPVAIAPAVKPAAVVKPAAPAVKAAPVPAPTLLPTPAPMPVAAPAAHAAEAPAAPAAPPAVAAPAPPREPDITARPTEAPRPVYPRAARQRGWQGVVMVLVQVAEDGAPLEVAVKASSGHAVLDEAALDAVKRWRFSPARQNGRPVVAAVEVPVRFSLEG